MLSPFLRRFSRMGLRCVRMMIVPRMLETMFEIGSEKKAAAAPKKMGRMIDERNDVNFLVSDSGSEICTCPRAVIISTFTYCSESGMIMHS